MNLQKIRGAVQGTEQLQRRRVDLIDFSTRELILMKDEMSHSSVNDAAAERDAQLRRLDQLADWMDSRFKLPGTNIRFGLDSILGFLPGVGDGVTALPSVYLIASAHSLGVPKLTLLRMAWNVLIDMMIGTIPLIGDIFDIGFKANRRNIALMRKHVESNDPYLVPESHSSVG